MELVIVGKHVLVSLVCGVEQFGIAKTCFDKLFRLCIEWRKHKENLVLWIKLFWYKIGSGSVDTQHTCSSMLQLHTYWCKRQMPTSKELIWLICKQKLLVFMHHWENHFLAIFPRLCGAGVASVNILSYGLDDRGSRVRFPAGAGNISPYHHVQNGSGAHPASNPMGTRGSFPGGKAAGVWSWPLTSI
jgi:hypothetical protein